MPKRNLDTEELKGAKELLTDIRERLTKLAGGDPLLLFAYRRNVMKELGYDERGKRATKRESWFPYKREVRAYVAGTAGLLTLVSAGLSVWLAAAYRDCTSVQIGLTVVWGAWPPLWFLFEHYFWFDNWDDQAATRRFQNGQKLWAKLWAGVGAILAVLLFRR